MFIRKNKNRNGSISVQIAQKHNRKKQNSGIIDKKEAVFFVTSATVYFGNYLWSVKLNESRPTVEHSIWHNRQPLTYQLP